MDLVIFGAGQLADVVTTYLEHHSDNRIVGYTVNQSYRNADQFRGLPLVDWETLENDFPPDKVLLFGPVSFREGNRFRRDRFLDGKRRGYHYYTFIHPETHIYTKDIGENVLILEGNTLQPFTEIGDNCVLWSNNHIGHHTKLGAHCFLTSHVGLSGNITVGEGVFFGGKSGAADNIQVGSWCIFSIGSIATHSIPDEAIVAAPKMRIIKGAARRYAKKLLG